MDTCKQRVVPTLVVLGLLSGCGGGGSSSALGSSAPPSGSTLPTTNATPGGIWRGVDSVSNLQVIGLVDEAGEFHFIRTDNVQYVGTATVSTDTISASFEGFTQLGSVFADNSDHGTGTVAGTVQARSTLSLSTQFKTDSGAVSNGTLDLTFDTLYNRASSLATISGNFSNNGVEVTLSSNGTIFWQDPRTSCVVNGTVSIINATYNAYRVQFTYASCTGQDAALNGLEFNGMATLDNTQSPEHAIVGATAKSANADYAVVLNMPRN